MITMVYNLHEPEQGGVGRYTYEILNRMKHKIVFNEIDLSPSFGKNSFEKLLSILWKRKQYLLNQKGKFGEINHFLQTEIFYPIKGENIITFHNPPPFTKTFYDMDLGSYAMIRSILFVSRYKDAIKNAKFLIANSQLSKSGILEMGFDEDKIKVINLGINEKFKIIKRYEERKNIIGYVGSFAGHKRIEKLLNDWKKNFKNFENYNLDLYGKNIDIKTLKNKYKKFKINFLGKMRLNMSVKIYNTFKAFVFPSRGESFGLPIIEAVACGAPVFVYKDAKITPEVKKYALEIESVSEIPEFLDAIKNNKLKKLSKNVKKEFDWNKNVEETERIYRHM